jgi:hypothetical protein
LRLRFNQVFVGLLVLAILSAFVLPADITNRLRGFQAIFAPVSRPYPRRRISVRDRIAPRLHHDTRKRTM